jgi:hypothetical protein
MPQMPRVKTSASVCLLCDQLNARRDDPVKLIPPHEFRLGYSIDAVAHLCSNVSQVQKALDE